jgi:hypothetical protein
MSKVTETLERELRGVVSLPVDVLEINGHGHGSMSIVMVTPYGREELSLRDTELISVQSVYTQHGSNTRGSISQGGFFFPMSGSIETTQKDNLVPELNQALEKPRSLMDILRWARTIEENVKIRMLNDMLQGRLAIKGTEDKWMLKIHQRFTGLSYPYND